MFDLYKEKEIDIHTPKMTTLCLDFFGQTNTNKPIVNLYSMWLKHIKRIGNKLTLSAKNTVFRQKTQYPYSTTPLKNKLHLHEYFISAKSNF